MGTECCHYVMQAARFGWDEWEAIVGKDWDERFDKYRDNAYRCQIGSHDGLTLVVDGMCGEYIFFGVVIAKAIDCAGLPIVDCQEAPHSFDDFAQKVVKAIGRDVPFTMSVYAFSHWH